jgi:hypothetical protein
MPPRLSPPVFLPGIATGIGSLPHTDARAAAELVLRCLPELPAVPQLPARDPREGQAAQWLAALPEVEVDAAGTLTVLGDSDAAPECTLDPEAHAGVFAFLDAASEQAVRPARVKAQVTGPLTAATALAGAGMAPERAFRRGAALARAWAVALDAQFAAALPESALVLFFDEPALAAWTCGRGLVDRDSAVDILSGALAAPDCLTGVQVARGGDLSLALEAGPQVVGVDVDDDLVADTVPIARFLDGEGWIAWGAVHADRPIGESADPHWRHLARVWCELTRRGCDPVPLRTRGMITPACGLAGYGASQAERLLGLARELAARVHDQAVAARLMLGA